MKCSIDGCETKAKARGWCNVHYMRWFKHGDPLWVKEHKRCSIEGCERSYYGRQYCHLHYQRMKRNGSPLAVKRIHGSVPERLAAYADVRGPDECHEWQRSRNEKGYGLLKVPGITNTAHRAMFYTVHGYLPPVVMHTCDNPPCVNPAHLKAGDAAANTRDMVSKGRHAAQRKDSCLRGHPLSGDNLVVNAHGRRQCRTCRNASSAAWQSRQKKAHELRVERQR